MDALKEQITKLVYALNHDQLIKLNEYLKEISPVEGENEEIGRLQANEGTDRR